MWKSYIRAQMARVSSVKEVMILVMILQLVVLTLLAWNLNRGEAKKRTRYLPQQFSSGVELCINMQWN